MFTFIKLPHRLFIPKKEEESYIKIIKDDKVVFVLDYLLNNVSKARDKVNFTLENMIIECGFSPSQKKKRNNEKFKNILKGLLDLKIIEYDFVSAKMKSKQMYSLTLKLIMENDFIQLFDIEKNTILNSTIKEINNRRLLIYYGYLKSRMYRRPKDDDLGKTGGRPEVCFPSFKTITFDLGLNDKIINKYNEALIELNFIRIANAGHFYYIDDKTKMQRESCNIYTMYNAEFEETWKENLKEGIKYYKKLEVNKTKIFTNKTTYKNNNRKLNGELGSIIKKEKLGTATEKDISRKNEILMSASEDADSKFQIKGLLSNNEGKILSDIFGDVYSEKRADKWFDIELSLGLVKDNTNDLLVDYEYYKWVVTNYEKCKHDYYVNCVKKHKADAIKPKGKGLFGVDKKVIKKAALDDTTRVENLHKFIYDTAENNDDFKELFRAEFKGIKFKTLIGDNLEKVEIRVKTFIADYKATKEIDF